MAQALFDQAKKLMADGKFVLACPKLEESQKLDPGIGTLLNLADCLEHEGRGASAWSKFLEAASAAREAGQSEREKIARDRAAELAPRLPNIVIKVPDADATPGIEVKRDGVVVGKAAWGSPMPADQGAHAIVVTAPGRKTWESTVTVRNSGGGVTEVTVPPLALAPAAKVVPVAPAGPGAGPTAPEAAPAKSSALGFTLLGVGAAVGIGGGVIALLEASKGNDAADARDRSAYDSAKSTMIIGDVAAGVGGAAAVAGLVVLLSGDGGPAKGSSRTAPWISASTSGVQVGGAW